MIELTEEQRQTLLHGQPVRLSAPEMGGEVVLLSADLFARLETLFGQDDDSQFARSTYPQTWELLMREGWDDPSMDVYNGPNYPGQS